MAAWKAFSCGSISPPSTSCAHRYRDIQSAEIPEFTTPGGVRAIAGRSHGIDGAMQREVTEPCISTSRFRRVRFAQVIAAGAQCVRLCVSRALADWRYGCAGVAHGDAANDAGSDGVVLHASSAGARLADRRQAVGRAHRAVRPFRHEHQRRDLPGGAGLPIRKVRRNDVIAIRRQRPDSCCPPHLYHRVDSTAFRSPCFPGLIGVRLVHVAPERVAALFRRAP